MRYGCNAFVFLFVGLAAVWGEEERKNTFVPKSIHKSQSNIGWTCQSTCNVPARVITCRFESGRKCFHKFYMVYLEKVDGEGDWETIIGSCKEEISDTCEDILKSKNGRRTIERTMRSTDNNLGIQKMFSNVNRRSMETYGDDVMDYEPRSLMVSSSGNGHAYASDGQRLVESHYGNNPIYSKPMSTDFFTNPLLYIFAQSSTKTDDGTSPLWMTEQENIYPSYDYSYKKNYEQSYVPYSMTKSNPYGKPYVDLYGNYGGYNYPAYQTGSPLSQFLSSFSLPDPWLWIY